MTTRHSYTLELIDRINDMAYGHSRTLRSLQALQQHANRMMGVAHVHKIAIGRSPVEQALRRLHSRILPVTFAPPTGRGK